jgi:hypothetical protein
METAERDFRRGLAQELVAAEKATDADMPGVTTLNGQKVGADYLRSSAQLESIGDGRYLLRLGGEAKLFSQSIAGANTRASVLQDYISEIRQKTGTDLSKELMALIGRRRLCAFPGCRIMAPSESGKSIWKISHDRPDTISRNRHALGQRSRTGAGRVRDHGV